MIWPSASRAYELLNGVKIQFDNAWTHLDSSPDRHKRQADDAFGREKSSDLLQREAFGVLADKATDSSGVQDISTRIMAHMLGLDIPGIEPSTSYLPGYEWWPRHDENGDGGERERSSGGQTSFEGQGSGSWYQSASGSDGYGYEFEM
jgi:hypothetical protein